MRLHPDFSHPGKQPQGPVEVDWDNPLTRGLSFLGHNGYDYVSKLRATRASPADTYVAASYGMMAFQKTAATANAHRVDTNVFPQMMAGSTEHTILLFKESSGTTNNYSCPFWSAPTLGAHYCSLMRSFGDFYRVEFRTTTGPKNYDLTSMAYDTVGPEVHAITRNGATLKGFVEGAKVQTVTSTTEAIASSASYNGYVEICGRGVSSAEYALGSVYLAASWNRELSEAEIANLSRDPYQIFKPAIPTPLIAPAAAGNNIAAATAALTLTTYAASITQAANVDAGP